MTRKPPAIVPVSATTAATARSGQRAAAEQQAARGGADGAADDRPAAHRLTAQVRHPLLMLLDERAVLPGLRDGDMPESYERCPDGWQSHHEQPAAPR